MSWIDDSATEHLLCRDTGIRHRWDPDTAYRDGHHIMEVLICLRCDAKKIRKLTRTGLVVKNEFQYPDGYLRKGEGRVTKQENAAIRLSAMHRRYKGL